MELHPATGDEWGAGHCASDGRQFFYGSVEQS